MGRQPRIIQTAFPIHIVARTNNREEFPIRRTLAWRILCDYLYLLSTGFKLGIHSFVMMPNHFHLIVSDPEGELSAAMAYFMREVTREMNRHSGKVNKLWGGTYHSSIISDPLYYLHAYKYVYRNPVKAGLVDRCESYRFSTLAALLGEELAEFPMIEDVTLLNDPCSTIEWLNTPYSERDTETLQRALKRKKFSLSIDRSKRKPSGLTKWDSIPPSFQSSSWPPTPVPRHS
jgi:putative transposase